MRRPNDKGRRRAELCRPDINDHSRAAGQQETRTQKPDGDNADRPHPAHAGTRGKEGPKYP
jgi:hypothetical protein